MQLVHPLSALFDVGRSRLCMIVLTKHSPTKLIVFRTEYSRVINSANFRILRGLIIESSVVTTG